MKILDKTKYYDISNLNEQQVSKFIEYLKSSGDVSSEVMYMINRVSFPINRKYMKAHIIYWDQTKWNLAFNNYIDALTLF